jgi:hypothetical protein
MQEQKLSLLHDHYKETFAHIQDYLKLRDRLFAYVLVIVTLMLFQMYSPSGSAGAISELLAKKLELKTPIDISFLSSILWFALLGIVIRYYQTVVHIERQYDYIHNIEDQLSSEYDGKAFTREGKSYLGNYPVFSSWAWILYTIVFPSLLLVIVVVKIVGEVRQAEGITVLLSIDALITLCIFLSSVFYVLLLHFRK